MPWRTNCRSAAVISSCRRIGRRGGQVEATFLEPLVKDGEPVAIPPKHFEPVAAFVAEDEQMSDKRIFVAEVIADDGEESVEASAHIDRLDGDKDAGGWRQGQHGRASGLGAAWRMAQDVGEQGAIAAGQNADAASIGEPDLDRPNRGVGLGHRPR